MKGLILKLHLYGGLVAGLFVAAISLSGALMILEGNLLPSSFIAERYRIEPQTARAPVEGVATQIQRRYGRAPTQLTVRSDPSRPDEYRLGRRETVFVDPYLGEIVGFEEDFRTPFSRALWTFHATFLLGTPGRWLVGITTAVLLATLVAGTVLGYDTVKRGGRRALSLRWPGHMRIWNRRFHTALGLAVSTVLIIIAFTGCFIAFQPIEDTTLKLLGASANTRDADVRSSRRGGNTARISADAALDAAGMFDNERSFSRMRLRFPADNDVAFLIERTGVGDASARERIFIDQYNGERLTDPLGADRIREQSTRWSVRSFHYGSFSGSMMEAIWFLACLTVPVFFVSGYALWAGKRRKPANMSRGAATSSTGSGRASAKIG